MCSLHKQHIIIKQRRQEISKGQNALQLIMDEMWPIMDKMYVADWLERLTANAEVATFMGLIPASSDTVESEGRQMKQC